MTMTVQELALMMQGTVVGDSATPLSGLATLEDAGPGQVSFLSNRRYERYLATTRASAVIVGEHQAVDRTDLVLIRCKDPYFGFVIALRAFHPGGFTVVPGVHASAVVDPGAELGEGVMIGAGAVIGARVRVGRGTAILDGAVVTEGVTIGEHCIIYPNVTLLAEARIGNRVIIHAGTTIGSDGFGFAPVKGRFEKIPQVGTVVIEDDVEIGANCAIDRAALGATRIGAGTKLDNLIQVAHNVHIGSHTVIAAQSGISGSTTVGSHCMIGGQVGIVGHIDIGDQVSIGAQAGVAKSLVGPGKVFRGAPAQELRDELRMEASVRQLPDLIAHVRALEARIEALASSLPSDHQ